MTNRQIAAKHHSERLKKVQSSSPRHPDPGKSERPQRGPFKCYVTQMGVGGYQIFRKKALRRCKVQCYLHYKGVGGGPISRKKALRNT